MTRAGGTNAARASRLWWAGPTALVVLGGSAVAIGLAPGFGDSPKLPDRVVVGSPSTTASPEPSERPHGDGRNEGEIPEGSVVSPSRPVVSEPPDDHGGPGSDDDDSSGRDDHHGGDDR